MTVYDICHWLENTRIGTTIGEKAWLFPTIETVHVIAIAIVVGTIAMIDLRLLGIASTRIRVSQLCEELLPFTWIAFVCAVIAGSFLFVSNATTYVANPPFLAKMCLLVLAGSNMLVFHLGAFRRVGEWDLDAPTSRAAKISGGLSLLLWVSVVILGRWIAFV